MSKSEQTLDAFLVLDYRTGNKKALNLLVNRWQSRICSRAYSYTKDYDQAKDIAQDSWKVIISKLHGLKDPELFGSWVMRIVTRKSIDWLRKENSRRRRNYQYIEGNSLEDDEADKLDEVYIVQKAIQQLKPKHQEILQLYYSDNIPISTIAILLECSEGTIKSRLHYARQQLKEHLKQ